MTSRDTHRRARTALPRGIAVALVVLVSLAQVGAAASAAPAPATARWGGVRVLSGVSTVTLGTPANVAPTISCSSVGNCAAVGTYLDHEQETRIFVQDEVDGVWSPPRSATGADVRSGQAYVGGVSCAADGDCVAVGEVGGWSFIEEEMSGVWQPLKGVPGLPASVPSQLLDVDCTGVGTCTAVGQYVIERSDVVETYTVSETGGVWSSDKEMAGSAAIGVSAVGAFDDASPSSLSCADADDCVVSGFVSDENSDSAGFLYAQRQGTWQPASLVTSTTQTNFGEQGSFIGDVTTVSCPAPGACVAGGYGMDSAGTVQAYLFTESSTGWDTQEAPGTAALNASGGISFSNGITLSAGLTSISCPSAGNCTGVGYYGDASAVEQGFIIDETAGVWQDAVALPGLAALNVGASHYNFGATPSAVACSAVGNCTIVGTYTDANHDLQYFTADESSGAHDDAAELPGSSALPVDPSSDYAFGAITSLWCGSVGNCVLTGPLPVYGIPNRAPVTFTAIESAGTWQTAVGYMVTTPLMVGTSASVITTQCPAAGDCEALGEYVTAAGTYSTFTAEERRGRWGADTTLAGPTAAGDQYQYSYLLSCGAVGSCVAGGSYLDAKGDPESFIVTEVDGRWRPAVTISGLKVYWGNAHFYGDGIDLSALTCTGPGACVGLGQYQASRTAVDPFLVVETHGVWRTLAHLRGLSALGASQVILGVITCTSTGNCLVGGQYVDHHHRYQSLLLSESKGAWGAVSTVPGTIKLNVGPQRYGGGEVSAAACSTPGNCVVSGEYVNRAGNGVPYVDAEHAGTWGRARTLPHLGSLLGKMGLSQESEIGIIAAACPSPTTCIVLGDVPVQLVAITKHTEILDWTDEAFSLVEVNGVFQRGAKIVSKPPNAGSVSDFSASGIGCPSATQCLIVGQVSIIEPVAFDGAYSFEMYNHVASASESATRRSAVFAVPGQSPYAYVDSMSCKRGAGCALGGTEEQSSGQVPFVATTH